MTTKAQERKALEQIRKIVEGLGEDSYIGTAFEGCFEIAEENIEFDFAISMKDKVQSAKNRLDGQTKRNEELEKEIKELKESAEDDREAAEEWMQKYQNMVNDKNIWRDDCTKTRESLKAEQSKNEALEQEIIKLKAKLYDMMTA